MVFVFAGIKLARLGIAEVECATILTWNMRRGGGSWISSSTSLLRQEALFATCLKLTRQVGRLVASCHYHAPGCHYSVVLPLLL